MSNELLTIIEYIGQNRSISRDTLIKALENAILSASRKSIHPASDLKIKIDPPTGTIKAWAMLEVVDHVPMNSDQIVIGRAQERFPNVKVGDKVTPDTVVCIVEAMKVMNEIKAEKSGVIRDILVENGSAVEFGQPLFVIE